MMPWDANRFACKQSLGNRLKLVAIHLGVSNSSRDQEAQKGLAKSICEQVMRENKIDEPAKLMRSKLELNLCKNPLCKQYADQEVSCEVAEQAAVRLVELLENHKSLNCGYGSNLNINGQVECDASLMSDRKNNWTGIGAVHGCKNPILLAKALHDHWTIPRPLGLIQPNFLVGSGARLWMLKHCPHLSSMDSRMISSEAFSKYQKFKSRFDSSERSHTLETTSTKSTTQLRSQNCSESREFFNRLTICDTTNCDDDTSTKLDHGSYCLTKLTNVPSKYSLTTSQSRDEDEDKKNSFVVDHPYSKSPVGEIERNCDDSNDSCDIESILTPLDDMNGSQEEDPGFDTVGAIAVDNENNFACAISSGGLLLKYKGRIGQAAIPGAGCWAEDSIAVTTTGVGEYLTVSLFAKSFHDKVKTFRSRPINSAHERNSSDQSAQFTNIILDCFQELFRSPALNHMPTCERGAGLLQVSSLSSLKPHSTSKQAIQDYDDPHGRNDLYLSLAHTTRSMCIGYMKCNEAVGHSIISYNDDNKTPVRIETMRLCFNAE